MPTRSGWTTLAGGLVALVAGRALGLLEIYLLGVAAFAAVVGALAWVRIPKTQLVVDRMLRPEHPTVGQAAQVELVVRNRGRRRAGSLVAHDAVQSTVGAHLALAAVPAGSSSTVGYQLRTRARGPISLGPLRLRREDPLGLARREVADAATSSVTVLPRATPTTGALLGTGRRQPASDRTPEMAVASSVAELDVLRPYQVGDDLRRVHWRASAHADELLVRRDEEPRRGLIVVVLDARTEAMDPERFEGAVSAAAGVVAEAASAGHRLRLTITDGTDTGIIDARRGRLTLLTLLAHAAQHPDGHAALPPIDPHRTDLVVLVTGSPTVELLPAGADDANLILVRCDAEPSGGGR